MIQFITNLFAPLLQIITDVQGFLSHLSTITASGINISNYFSWLGVLDAAWQGDINALLGGFSFLAVLTVARSVYRFYLALKQGVKWW